MAARKHLKKQPALPGKVTLLPARETSNTRHPVFSFEYLTVKDFSSYESRDRTALIDKLVELSQLTWQKITESGRHQDGFEKIKNFRLPEKVTMDVQVIAFRYNGLKAMIGFRLDSTFYLLKLDPKFKAYSHG